MAKKIEIIDTDNPPASKKPRRWWQLTLTQQIILALVLGIAIGWLVNRMGKDGSVNFLGMHLTQQGILTSFVTLRGIFLNLIKSIIAPLIFSTVVVGIAGHGNLKSVGRMGWKSLLYFEVVTTLALIVGLIVVNITRPGAGVVLAPSADDLKMMGKVAENHPQSFGEILQHLFPSSIIDAMAKGDVLQIVAFSVLFAMACAVVGEKAGPVIRACESISKIMFRFTEFVMRFAPYGVGAAMAYTVGHQGLGILFNLGKLIGSLYLALIIFVILVFGTVALIIKLPVRQFWKAIREPFILAFVTTSSESALPKAMENMERFGVPKKIVSFVMPTGYSFNLDGSTLYLAMASVFVAQAWETMNPGSHFTIGQQITMMLSLMLTTKGVAAVPRASLVVLFATLAVFGLPVEGVAVIFAVDELMDMARTSVNLVGNCLATTVVARWEGEFDDEKALAFNDEKAVAVTEE